MTDARTTRYLQAEDAFWALHGAPARRAHHIEVPDLGFTMRVQELGPPDGPPVVFLHGSPNCGSVWAPLIAQLPELRALLVDGPGFGLSQRPGRPLGAREHARPVLAMVEALSLPQVDLVGSSYGSCVAMTFAAEHPTRVGRIVHQGHPGIVPDQPGYGLMFYLRFFSAMARMKLSAPSARSVQPIWRAIGHGPSIDAGRFAPGVLDWYASLVADTDTLEADAALTRAVMKGLGLDDAAFVTREELAAGTAPTGWYWGEHETLGGEEVARKFASMVPGSVLALVPGAGHLPWLDDPVAAAAWIRAFLAR